VHGSLKNFCCFPNLSTHQPPPPPVLVEFEILLLKSFWEIHQWTSQTTSAHAKCEVGCNGELSLEKRVCEMKWLMKKTAESHGWGWMISWHIFLCSYSPTSSSLSPRYHITRNPRLSNPVPNKSPRAVRKVIAMLSGSEPRFQMKCTSQSATRSKITTCRETSGHH